MLRYFYAHSNWGSTIAKICGEKRVQLRAMTCGNPGTVVPGERGTYAAAPSSSLVLNSLVRFCLLRQECVKVP